MKKPIHIFLILILFANQSLATSQVQDVLFVGSDTLYFYESPLETIGGIGGMITDLREDEFEVSSDCWRGFRAEWRIIDGFFK